MKRITAVAGLACMLAASLGAQGASRFEVASVRPNTSEKFGPSPPHPPDGLVYVNFPLYQMVINAYGVQLFQAEGMPGWAINTYYDISAKASGPITDAERMLMLRTLLAERFNLKARLEQQERTAYVLTRVRADGPLGPGLTPRPECVPDAKPCEAAGTAARGGGFMRGQAFPMSQVRRMLSIVLSQVVVDETKIDAIFDVDLSWRPDTAPPDDPRPSLFTALEEQAGLKLTPQRRPVETLVIESLDRATPQ